MKTLFQKKLAGFGLLALLATSCDWVVPPVPVPDPVASPTTGNARKVLPVIRVAQQTSVWCWVATSEMVLNYYDRPTGQCVMLSNWYRANCCWNPGLCQSGGTLEQIRTNLRYFGGLQASIAARPLTLAEIKAEIDGGRPIIIAYSNFQAGHVVVIFGYSGSNLHIYDPLYYNPDRADQAFVVPYGQSFSYGGSQTWTHSIYKIQ
jgi:hypothetical protein